MSIRWLANPHQGHSHYPHSIWSSKEYVIHDLTEDSHARYIAPYTPPAIMLTMEPRMAIIIEQAIQSFLNTLHLFKDIFGTIPNHIPLKHRHSNSTK